jgi:hypothetical protein
MRKICIDGEKILFITEKKKLFSNQTETKEKAVFLKDIEKLVKDITFGNFNCITIFTKDGNEESIEPKEVESLESTFSYLASQRSDINNFKLCTFDMEGSGEIEIK